MSLQLDPLPLLSPALVRASTAAPARVRLGRTAPALLAYVFLPLAVFAALSFVSTGLALALAAGLALGHTLDLLFGRFYSDSELRGPLHRCDGCRSPLRAAFAMPLVGFLWWRGRCPDCGSRLPLRALVLPAGACGLFGISYVVFDQAGAALLGGLFATVFLALTLTDLERRLLPNRIIYPAILLAAALSWGWPETPAVAVLLGGGVAVALAGAILLFSLPFGPGAFGMGDVKMIVLIGFVVGFPAVVTGLLAGTIAAGVVAGFLLLTGLRGSRDYIPHGPFLALGAVIALFLR
ncbi:MAG: A24 family peptidase [Dehalococcoidia bacterium]|nr:A24 family peptidase [Dehalococcoidia bacterium]